jgi:glutamyl-tRNA synthetase
MGAVRVRFAGSPTGDPHIGNMRTAIYNWLFARHYGGEFIVRVEDTDTSRSTRESVRAILTELRWLGLGWDEGPECGGAFGPYFQSERLDTYSRVAEELVAKGFAYECFCAPEELRARREAQGKAGLPPKYDRTCLGLSAAETEALKREGRPRAIRFRIEEGRTAFHDLIRGDLEFDNELLDDFVMLKSDGFPTYNYAVVVDDHLMQITHVIRGEEHISNTPKQILQYNALGYEPPQFAHLPIILGPDRSKLSKRHGAPSISEYRRLGYLADALVNFLSLLGWSPGDATEKMTRDELVSRFTLEGVTKHGAVFDADKLTWMNSSYLREMPSDRLYDLSLPYLRNAGLVAEDIDPAEESRIRSILALVQERMRTLGELPEIVQFFFGEAVQYDPKAVKKWLTPPGSKGILQGLRDVLASLQDFGHAETERVSREYAAQNGLAASEVFHRLRTAVTGRTVGPSLFEVLELVGKERVLGRIDDALRLCAE